MKVTRLFLVPLFGCLWSVCAGAQTSEGEARPKPPMTFNWPATSVPFQGSMQGFVAPNGMRAQTGPLPQLRPGDSIHVAQNDRLCYSLRTYRLKRDAPDSDTTSMVGRGSCLPASSVHEKGVGGSAR